MANGKENTESPFYEPPQAQPEPEEVKRQLYNNLVEDNYEMPSFSKFKHDMSDEKFAEKFYDDFNKVYDLPEKERFKFDLGIKKKEEPEFQQRVREGEEEGPSYTEDGVPYRLQDHQGIEWSNITGKPDQAAKEDIKDTLEGKSSFKNKTRAAYPDRKTVMDKLGEFQEKADSIHAEYGQQIKKFQDQLKKGYEQQINQLQDEEKQSKLIDEYNRKVENRRKELEEKQKQEIKDVAADMGLKVTDEGKIKVPEKEITDYGKITNDLFQQMARQRYDEEDDPYMKDMLERFSSSSKRLFNDLPANLAAISERLHNSVLSAVDPDREKQTYWQELAKARKEDTEQLMRQSQRYDESIVGLVKEGEIGKAIGETGLQLAGQIPQLLAFIGTGAAGAAKKGLATIATGVGAEDYVDNIDRDMNEWTRVIGALTAATSEYAFEGATTVPIIKSLQKNASVVGREALEGQMKEFFTGMFNKAGRRIMRGTTPGLMEAAGEIGTEFTQNWSDVISGKLEPEEIGRGLGDVAITSFIIGEGMASVGGALNYKSRKEAKDYLKGVYNSIPQEMDNASKLETMKLLVERDRLGKMKETMDADLQDGVDQQIENVKQQIKNIYQEQVGRVEETGEQQQEAQAEQARETLEEEGEPVYKVGDIQYENREAFLSKVREFEGQEDTPEVTIENDEAARREVENILQPEKAQEIQQQEETPTETVELGQETKAEESLSRVLKSKPENTFTRPINRGEDQVGEITVEKGDNQWSVKRVDVNEDQRNQGYGKEAYRQLNRQAQQEGKELISDRKDKINDNAKNLWNSLVKSGEAVEEGGRYKMNPPETTQQAQQETTAPTEIKQGQRFKHKNKQWEFTGERDQTTGDYIAKSLEQDPEQTRIAPGAVESLEFIQPAQKQKAKPKQAKKPQAKQAKAKPIPEVKVSEIAEENVEKAKKVKEDFNNLASELEQLPEGERTTEIAKRYKKVSSKLPQHARDNFTKELKKKQQKYQENQRQLEEEGQEFVEEEPPSAVEFVDLMDRAENLDGSENPKQIYNEYKKVADKLTKNEEAQLKAKLKEKKEAHAKWLNEQNKERAEKGIKDALDDLDNALTGRPKLMGDEKSQISDAVKRLAQHSFDYTMESVEELMRNTRNKIRESIPDKLRQRKALKQLQELRPDIETMFDEFKSEQLLQDELEVRTEGIKEATDEIREFASKKLGKEDIDVDKFGVPSGMPKERKRAIRRAGTEGMVSRRKRLNLEIFRLNNYARQLRENHTKEQLEVLPFLIEGTGVPKRLNRPDLEEAYEKYKNDPQMKETMNNLKDHFDQMWRRAKEAIPEMSEAQIQNYVTHIWDIPQGKRKVASNWFKTQNKYLNKRYISTLREGIEKYGLQPKELSIDRIMLAHGKVTINAAVNREFVDYIESLHQDGYPLVLPKSRAEGYYKDWKPIDHPAFNKTVFKGKTREETKTGEIRETVKLKEEPVFVDPDLYPIVNAVVSNDMSTNNFVRHYERFASYIKKAELTLSFFHHVALTETAVAKMGVPKTMKAIAKIHKNLAQGKPPAYANTALAEKALGEYGIQLGASYDVDFSGIQRDMDKAANKLDKLIDKKDPKQKDVLKALNIVRGFAKGNKAWDGYLWSYLHDGLKLYAVENIDQNIPGWLKTEEQKKQWKINQGQLINDTFGGQHAEMLMASTGIGPRMWRAMKHTLLSRDWTISTLRQALGVTGFGDIYRGQLGETATRKEKLKEHIQLHRGRMTESGKFWARAAIIAGLGINALNAFNREKDKEQNPQYYMNAVLSDDNKPPIYREEDTGKYYIEQYGNKKYLTRRSDGFYMDGKKIEVEDRMNSAIDHTMFGNTPGHESLLFTGRDDEGIESYLRWGKQFREFPEFVSGWKEFTNKLGGKASPPIQLVSQIFTGKSLSGYTNYDIEGKEDAAWIKGVTGTIAQAWTPFSMSSFFRGDKDFKPTDMFMPSNKGMTKSQCISEFEDAIEESRDTGHTEKIDAIYWAAVQNGLPVGKLFKMAESNVRAKQTTEIGRTYRTIEELNEQIKKEEQKEDPDQVYLYKLKNRKQTLMKDKAWFDKSLEIHDAIERYLNAYDKRYIEDLDNKLEE